MNTNDEYSLEAQIERYLLGEMQKEELKAFKERIDQDPELEKEIQAYSLLFEQLDDLRLREKIKRAVADTGHNGKMILNIPLSVWLVAATLLLSTGIFMYRVFLTPESNPIANKQIELTDSIAKPIAIQMPTNDSIHEKSASDNRTLLPNEKPATTKQTSISKTGSVKTKPPTTDNPYYKPAHTQPIAGNIKSLETEDPALQVNYRTTETLENYKHISEFESLEYWENDYTRYTQDNPTKLNTDTVLQLISRLYELQRSTNYRKGFKNLSQTDPKNFAIKYYLAHSHLIEKDVQRALPLLEEIHNSPKQFSFTPSAKYLLGLCYANTNNKEKACSLLCTLLGVPNSKTSQDARKLLGNLECLDTCN